MGQNTEKYAQLCWNPCSNCCRRLGPVTSHDIRDTARLGGIRNQDRSVYYSENNMRSMDYVFNQFLSAILSWVVSHLHADALINIVNINL